MSLPSLENATREEAERLGKHFLGNIPPVAIGMACLAVVYFLGSMVFFNVWTFALVMIVAAAGLTLFEWEPEPRKPDEREEELDTADLFEGSASPGPSVTILEDGETALVGKPEET